MPIRQSAMTATGTTESNGVDDETSKVHQSNRLETCQSCHQEATEGFVTFRPHGNTRDFDRYPGHVDCLEVYDRAFSVRVRFLLDAHGALVLQGVPRPQGG